MTSFLSAGLQSEQIDMLAVTPEAAWRVVTPLIAFEVMPNGTGDAVAALFTAEWLDSGDIATNHDRDVGGTDLFLAGKRDV